LTFFDLVIIPLAFVGDRKAVYQSTARTGRPGA
jgi:hypothetical protein